MSEPYYKSLLELRKVLDYDLLKEIERLVINLKNTEKWIKKFARYKKITYKKTFHLKSLNLVENHIVDVLPVASNPSACIIPASANEPKPSPA